ncbi:hypothetical protein LAZ67_19001874 [Cordylochernes scorpioides]|uniref:Endonuclease/exonuclease/phosphatase domain-containing protein n=1 Tax=Cordylochernes scorpioides TaxID=51811 RepID=A0ABY6LI05_9ARAC|nr:hypothetical protein LAZ67_19001874 [Cordylochernes scorpioides]
MNFRVATLNTRGITALRLIIQLCCFLRKNEIDVCFLQETNVISLDDARDLCHGYSAVAPATTTVGSGLACVFAPGVVVHRQQILENCPGGLHDIIAALANKEDTWIFGDLNISDESAKDLASGSAKPSRSSWTKLTFFDAALEYTRVATIGSRVDARRLDRILLPSGFCDRVTQNQTIDYAYSDHRAILIQFDEWNQLFLADIYRGQIAASIHSLPNGRASGWDGLSCEFSKAFEDFFAEVIWQVFEASRLRGALPSSSRRSKVILLPKSHGGPDLKSALFEKLGLPSAFLGWITVLYRVADASIQIGDVYTRAFPLLNGVEDPPSPSAPPISALLRLAPVIERVEALLCEASMKIEDTPPGDLWREWGKLKRDLVEDIKCLSIPCAEDEDYIARASRFLRSRLEAEISDADYPSLPELGRVLHLRLPRSEMETVFDAQGNPVRGESLRHTVLNFYGERLDSSACSPETIAGFLHGDVECITLEDSNPLH